MNEQELKATVEKVSRADELKRILGKINNNKHFSGYINISDNNFFNATKVNLEISGKLRLDILELIHLKFSNELNEINTQLEKL